MDIISSLQNAKIKNVVLLIEKAKERREQARFVVEGAKEVELLLKSNYTVTDIFIHEKLTQLPDFIKKSTANLYSVSEKVFEKIAYRENKSDIVALAKTQKHTLAQLKLTTTPLLIVLEGIEKPGNLGAILRTADACNADAVIVCEPNTDIYNPNCIRNSVGTFFSKQLAICSNEELSAYLAQHQIKSFATAITTEHYHYQTSYKEATAFIFGTEAHGLTDYWLQHADEIIKIPMLGINDSLNVSNSVAICVYEALRQREG
jgi:TrmH family RNA methyltransferase